MAIQPAVMLKFALLVRYVDTVICCVANVCFYISILGLLAPVTADRLRDQINQSTTPLLTPVPVRPRQKHACSAKNTDWPLRKKERRVM